MTQSFPNVKGSDRIDTGIMNIQERDNASLTLFWGPTPVYGAVKMLELSNNQLKNPISEVIFGILEENEVKSNKSEQIIGSFIYSFETNYVYDENEEIIGYINFSTNKVLSFNNITLGTYIDGELKLYQGEGVVGDELKTLAEIETYLDYQGWINSEEPHEFKCWNPIRESWEIIINPSEPPVKIDVVESNFQRLNENLTEYSSVEIPEEEKGILVHGTFIPVSNFYVSNLSTITSISDFKKIIGIGTLAEKSMINTTSLADNSIPKSKISKDVVVDNPFKVGDTVISLVNKVKDGFVRMSNSQTQNFTVGNLSSSSTYRGDLYFNLFEFIWKNLHTDIFTSSGGIASKGDSAEKDWLANKRLNIPTAYVPNSVTPSVAEMIPNGNIPGTYNVNIPNGLYKLIVVGAGGGCGARNEKSDYKGPGGAGGCGGAFDGYVRLYNGSYTVVVGKGGEGCNNSKGTYVSLVTSGADGTQSRFGNIVISNGGTGGKGYRSANFSSNNYYGFSRNESVGGQGGIVTILDSSVFIKQNPIIKNGDTASGSNGGSDGKDYTRNIAGTGYSVNGIVYGQGNAYNDGWDGTALQKTGGNGFVSLRFIAPIEYDTVDSNTIKMFDNLYDSLNFYMKY